MPSWLEHQLPMQAIGKKNKHPNNNTNSSQVILENFFNKLVDAQPDQTGTPPPQAEGDNEDHYDTQFISAQSTIPEGFLQQCKI